MAEETKVSAAAQKLIDENGLDVTLIAGSGKDGQVTKTDVEVYLAAQKGGDNGGDETGNTGDGETGGGSGDEGDNGSGDGATPGDGYPVHELTQRQGYYGKINGKQVVIKPGTTVFNTEDDEVYRQLVYARVLVVPQDDERLLKVIKPGE